MSFYAEYDRLGVVRSGDGRVLLRFPTGRERDEFVEHARTVDIGGWPGNTAEPIAYADARRHFWMEWWVRRDADRYGEFLKYVDGDDLSLLGQDVYLNTQNKAFCR